MIARILIFVVGYVLVSRLVKSMLAVSKLSKDNLEKRKSKDDTIIDAEFKHID